MTTERKRKSPFWAGFFNFFFPGLGYLYVGSKREFFKVGLLVGNVALVSIIWFETSADWTGVDTATALIEVFVAILFGVDAYKDAEVLNSSAEGLSPAS